MNEEEKKVYCFLLDRIKESNSTNCSNNISRLREFIEVIALRIKAEKGKGAWC